MQPIPVTEAQILQLAAKLYEDDERIEATELAETLPAHHSYFKYVMPGTRRSHVTRALRKAGYHHSNIGSKHYWSRVELEPVVKEVRGITARKPGVPIHQRVLPIILGAFPIGRIFTNYEAVEYLRQTRTFAPTTCKTYATNSLTNGRTFEHEGRTYMVRCRTRNAGNYKAGKKEFVLVD